MNTTPLASFTAPDGRRLAYADSGGDGPPVLCLAGLTRNHRDFAPLARHLSPRYRVIRPDSRGRGGSAWAEDPHGEYTIPVETGDAMALLGHLGLGSVAVIGTSRGGILGMGLAAAGLASALVLNDLGAEIDTAGLRRIQSYIGQSPPEAFDAAVDALIAANADDFPEVPRSRWEAHARAIYNLDETGRVTLSYDPRLGDVLAAGLIGAPETIPLWPLFQNTLEIPVLALRGTNSDIVSRQTLVEMQVRHQNLITLEIADRGHAPFLDEAPALAAIDAFLEGNLV